MKLIVGLGNPGREYECTRHNIGFMFLDSVASKLNIEFNKKKFNGLYAECVINGEKVILLKPQSYINLSGEVISKFKNFYKIDIKDILIISDDLDMDVGKIKFKSHGSSGGHNGLKNIEHCLGTNEYKRLKIGISNNKFIDTKDYVLSKISIHDLEVYDIIFLKSLDYLNDFVSIDFNLVMNKYN